MPAPVRHRGYRDVQMLLRTANDAALGLLVGDRIARRTLEPLEAEHASTPLSGLYSEVDIPDVGRFDFRVPRAVAKLQEAERELCVMAVPFAVSLYNEYLVSAAELLELAHVSRPPTPAREMMLGQVERHLRDSGVALEGDLAGLLRVVKVIRNQIVHAAARIGEDAIARWGKLPPSAQQIWIDATGATMPLGNAEARIKWGGPEIRGVFGVVRRCILEINLALQTRLPREFWADLVIHEFWMQVRRNGDRWGKPKHAIGFASSNGYGPLKLSENEMREAIARAPTTGWRPDLRPYWERPIPHGALYTQPVLSRDIKGGRLRIPMEAKHLLPVQATTIDVKLREQGFSCPYRPNPEGKETRSGTIHIGDALQSIVTPGQKLAILPLGGSVIGLQ